MPNRGSWDGKWSGQQSVHIKKFNERKIDKSLVNRNFFYDFGDGWTACVSTYQLSAKEAYKLDKINTGFCGYDWMVNSIIKSGVITKDDT